jgi:hypothetical protein
MKKHLIYWLAAFVIVMVGCQKELSFEGSNSPAKGSLQADVTGDCLPKTVNGTYVAASALVPATNTITVQVNVGKTGTYVVGTDTVNGYYFRGTGTFTTLGATNVTLRGNGTPFAAGVNNFVVSFDTTFCDIQVTVLPAGSGPAVFALKGSPGSCGTPTINGTYAKSVPLGASNTVLLVADVQTAGTYTINTTATNGMTFSGTGTLAVGNGQTITLIGSGTPTNTGSTTIQVIAGATQCSFVINVVAAITGTLGGGGGACTPSTVNGNYFQNVALTASNTVTVQITTSTVGPYSVTTDTQSGFSFSGSGTSNGATQTITLNGTGTPTSSGTKNFTVTFGTSTCTFTVTVSAGGAFTADCSSAFPNGTYQVGTPLNASNTVDIDINVTSLGPFNIVTTTTNGITFSLSGTFAVLGFQTITLVGSGTPTAQGTFNIPMPGTVPCTFQVICTPVPTIDWKFNIGATVYQGSTIPGSVIFDPTTPPFTDFEYEGDNPANDYITWQLIDLTGGINAGESYNSNSTGSTNIAFFYFTDGLGNLDLAADFSEAGVNIVFTITSHNVATRTIKGNFSGTAHDYVSGLTKTITLGTFTAIYP